jgi:hypothetical protein
LVCERSENTGYTKSNEERNSEYEEPEGETAEDDVRGHKEGKRCRRLGIFLV